MKIHSLLAMSLPLLLVACGGANRYCRDQPAYMTAESVPVLKAPEGMKLPAANGALQVPPPVEKPVAFGETVKDAEGEEQIVCLDRPPPMPAVAPGSTTVTEEIKTPAAAAAAAPASKP